MTVFSQKNRAFEESMKVLWSWQQWKLPFQLLLKYLHWIYALNICFARPLLYWAVVTGWERVFFSFFFLDHQIIDIYENWWFLPAFRWLDAVRFHKAVTDCQGIIIDLSACGLWDAECLICMTFCKSLLIVCVHGYLANNCLIIWWRFKETP